MKFKEFVALCNKLEFEHPECGEFDVVGAVEDFNFVERIFFSAIAKEVVIE